MKVRIVQYLCPQRHCMTAMAYQSVDGEPDPLITIALREAVRDLVERKIANPWCGICHAPFSAMFTEDMPTKFATMDEAKPAILASAEAQARTRQFFRAGRN